MNQFFKYLEKEHLQILFRDPKSKLQKNFAEILRVENKFEEFGYNDGFECIEDFLVKIYKELGKAFLFDIIHNLPNEAKNMLRKDFKDGTVYIDATIDELKQDLINDFS